MIPDQEQNQTEEYDMSGTVGTDTAGILALLADTSRAGRGNMYGGGEGGSGGFAPWASPGSNGVRIETVGQKVEDQNDCTRTLLGQGLGTIQNQFENATRAGENARICTKISEADQRNTDGQFRAELRGADQANAVRMESKLDAVIAQGHAAEVKGIEQYCDLKAGQATIVAKLDHNKEVGELNAELTALKTQIACGCTTGCSTPCGGHHGRG